MDWDLKIPPWNLQEMENQQQKMNNASVDVVKGLDLKLGASGELLGSPEKREGSSITRVAVPVSSNNHNNNNNNNNNNNSNSNSNSSKRVRAPSNASQNVACLVDGCKADLSGCREYHRRHKVCEAHSKTPVVLVGGREQRFCQQCSRFHLLMEFDEVKRSCRKRLDGHNRRRRKPQPDPSNSGSLFPVHQGPRYSFPHIFTTPTSDPSWTAVIKNDEDVMNQNNRSFHLFKRQHHSPPNSTFQIFKGKGFPFLHDDDAAICGGANVASSACQPLAAASSSENCNRKIFSNGLPNVLDTNCALSLLSSPSHTASINLGPVVPVEGIPFGQLAQQFGNQRRYFQPQAPNTVSSSSGLSCSGMDTEQIGNILIDGGDNADLNCHGLYSVGGGGALDGHSVALPFSW